jgi:hypothetical protein
LIIDGARPVVLKFLEIVFGQPWGTTAKTAAATAIPDREWVYNPSLSVGIKINSAPRTAAKK